MTLLVIGMVIWILVHLFPVVAPGPRAALTAKMGLGPSKGVIAVLILLGLVLIVLGYLNAEYSEVYIPPAWGVHLNNLLMLLAVYMLGAKHAKGRAKRVVRHPMLMSVILWAVAHLLVRGDLASVILFGGMAGWAIVSMLGANRRDGAWEKPAGGTMAGDIRHVIITLVVFAVFVLIHWQVFGYRPFPG